MPPTAAMRKTSLLSTAGGDPSSNSNARRTTASGRAIRNNTTRPANYYARPLAQQEPGNGVDDSTPAGFFPALTFFTDAVTALPREVMRQFTLMKEVEAKIHGPTERLGEVVDSLMQNPVPSRRGGLAGGQGGMISFTAANSAMGSANVSLVNGVAPYGASGQNSVAGSQVGEEPAQDSEDDMVRRKQFHEMRMLTHNLLANLDEKNVVLTEANRVLNAQLARLDSVMPHIDNEIPEEARLGSMTHWAYSDNRVKAKPTQPVANERNRRDVAATNSLAAAASAIHETEIAAARREAGNSATREKQGKGKNREAVDSEFEERPKKTGAKGAKGKNANALTGLGITTTNGEPVKRRKVDKSAIPPAMERQVSSTGKGKAARETPRSTPAMEPAKKATKAKAPPAPPKRKNVISAQASPALASSPLHTSFNAANVEEPGGRPQSARLRQNSSTNLRQAIVSNEDLSRPVSSAGKPATSKSRKRAREEPEEQNERTDGEQGDKTADTGMKREDYESQNPAPPSRSDSSHKNSGRQSKTGTPRSEKDPNSEVAMARTRSTRSMRGNGGDTPNAAEASATPLPSRTHSHKRNAHGSMSGLMKQIAPFNKSPDHRRGSNGDVDDPDESLDSQSDREDRFERRSGRRSGTGSRAVSRPTSSRKKSAGVDAGSGKDDHGPMPQDDGDTDMPNATDDQNIVSTMEGDGHEDGEGDGNSPPPPALTHSPSPSLSSQADASPPPPQPLDSNPHTAIPPSPSAHSSQNEDPNSPSPTAASPTPAPAAQAEPDDEPEPELEDEEEGEEPDPDDPNEPKYCYCLRGSYGDMVGCDNPKCEREWFHLGCTDLEQMPDEEESWFCEMCRPRGRGNGGRAGKGTGRGTGRGRGRG